MKFTDVGWSVRTHNLLSPLFLLLILLFLSETELLGIQLRCLVSLVLFEAILLKTVCLGTESIKSFLEVDPELFICDVCVHKVSDFLEINLIQIEFLYALGFVKEVAECYRHILAAPCQSLFEELHHFVQDLFGSRSFIPDGIQHNHFHAVRIVVVEPKAAVVLTDDAV